MSDDLETLRQELFRVHGVSVDLKDPIMIQHTLNKHLLEQMHKGQEELIEHFKSELEGIAYQWGNDAKNKAERILNASLAASKEAMAHLMQESVNDATKTMQAEFKNALRKAEAPAQLARNMTALNIGASLAALGASLILAWASLR
ncbi:conjugal transfer protein TraM [Pseudomonas helleri]|uniref:conjugal transfer protein TraM n=1 Tax=Pseudomonas helleri TaxID=1608996 RepID=UPI003FD551BC